MKLKPRPRYLASLLLALALLLGLCFLGAPGAKADSPAVWDGSIDTSWYTADPGAGSFVITTPAQLKGLSYLVNANQAEWLALGLSTADPNYSETKRFVGTTITLGADIYLNATTGTEPGDTTQREWIPIGGGLDNSGVDPGALHSWGGTFDGAGHTVHNFYLDRPEGGRDGSRNLGFIGLVAHGGLVKNLTVTGFINADRSIGGVVGKNWGTIENCVNYATVTGHESKGVGGIVGANWFDLTYQITVPPVVRGCLNYGTVTTYYPTGLAGGITGDNEGVVERCGNYGTIRAGVTGTANVGGITGNIKNKPAYADGEAVRDCFNAGTIEGGQWTAGVVAQVQEGEAIILNCCNLGTVTGGGNLDYAGGILGKNQGGTVAITNCYNTGTITAVDNAGAIAGLILAGSTTTNLYYLEGSAPVAFATGDGVGTATATDETEADMKDPAFALQVSGLGRAFVPATDNYPVLRWQTTDTSTLTGLTITTPPTKTDYLAGESFDPAGMVVSASYSDGTSVSYIDYSYAPTGALALSDTAVTVSYQGLSATQPITVTWSPVTGVSLDKTTGTIDVGATTQLTATVAPQTASNKTVTWTSTNEAVATVSAGGLVTGVGGGEATITATTVEGGFQAGCLVTVNPHVTGVTLDKTTATLDVGDTTQLVATVAPENASNKTVTWSSSNQTVATVNASGLVTARAAGSALITATTQDGGFKATCLVSVGWGVSQTLLEKAKLVASDKGTNDQLGYPVAADGDTVLVGAYQADPDGVIMAGAAYIFVRTDSGWTQQAKLVVSGAAQEDYFGWSVALDGDTALVGAYRADPDGVNSAGAAYVFVRSGGVWTQQAKLTASDKAASDMFGYSVALEGDTALIGAYQADPDTLSSAGAAYVFTRSGGAWGEVQKLTASDKAAGDNFGHSVALCGDSAVIGAPYADPDGVTNAGAAYAFTCSGGVWTQQAKLVASDGAVDNHFGYSVALSEDTALVGVGNAAVDSLDAAGAAHVFTRSGSDWTQQAKLTASDKAADDRFGRSVALDGNTALIGAYQADPDGVSNAGAAYVFVRAGVDWSQHQKLTASAKRANDNFGGSVALSGEVAVIGATGVDPDSVSNAGAAYVFGPPVAVIGVTLDKTSATVLMGSAAQLTATVAPADAYNQSVTWSSSNEAVATVAANGLVSAVSIGEATITATTDDGGHTATCLVTVQADTRPKLMAEQAKFAASDPAYGDTLGYSVAVDGDTAVVGAPSWGTNPQIGAAYVFVRTEAGWVQQAKLIASDAAAQARFGKSVAIQGDTIMVGGAENTGGAVYVFTRSGEVWTEQLKLTGSDGASSRGFGASIAIQSDTALIGAYYANAGTVNGAGAVYVFTRSGGLWTEQQKFFASDAANDNRFGWSVALDGDTALIGSSEGLRDGMDDVGSAYIFTCLDGVWTQQQKLVAPAPAGYDYFGRSVALSGDTALIGVHQANEGWSNIAGAAYVFTRSGDVWSLEQKLTVPGSEYFGDSVALEGDTALIGAYYANAGTVNNAGAAYLFTRTAGVWTEQQTLSASDKAQADRFGWSVALDGDTALIAASHADVDGVVNAGAAYIFGPVVPVTGVTLDKTSTTLAVGGTEQLTATIAPEDASNKTVTWTSSNESVATVSASGLVSALAVGEATITATTDDGHFTASCAVTVSLGIPLTLQPGWNLVAAGPGTTFPGVLFGWNGSTFASTPSPAAFQGYWTKAAGEQTVELVTVSGPHTAGLLTGWNLIGNPMATTATLTLPAGRTAFYYDALLSRYVSTTSLTPGQGAWVKGTAGGETVTFTAAP